MAIKWIKTTKAETPIYSESWRFVIDHSYSKKESYTLRNLKPDSKFPHLRSYDFFNNFKTIKEAKKMAEKIKKNSSIIYAEWKNAEGNFDNGFFATWEEWHRFSFNPEMEILKVKEVK